MEAYENILTEMEAALEILEVETSDVLVRAEKGIKIAKDVLRKIRKLTIENGFKTQQKEITFFKYIKPKVYSKLIYYVKLFSVESKRPRGSNKSQIKYFNNEIDKLQVYFNDNLEFYQYYRRGAIFLDDQYFLRGKADMRLHPDTFHFFVDPQFSTSHDSTVATILAYDMLIIYLKKEIDNLINYGNMETNFNAFQKQSKLFWTGSKTDLIELIYALNNSGAINSGTADIKELASACEQLFNVDLGNYYHTFIEIRSRKSNKTKFIDKLKESLSQRIDESDN